MTTKLISIRNRMLGLSLSVLFAAASGYGASQPSAKATAQIGYVNVISEVSTPTTPTAGPWQNILKNNIKSPNQKDLFIGVSLEVGLLTDTLVRSKNGVSDTSSATAGVEVRVLIDGVVGKPALPGIVTFGRRTQTLTATFQGIIDGCLSIDPITGGIVLDPDCVLPEELQLILETMNANTFNFIVADLASGVHVVQVQARITVGGSAQLGAIKARGLIGNGSMTVEEVRLIKNEDIELP